MSSQVEAYIAAVTGTQSPHSERDTAEYLYYLIHQHEALIDLLREFSPYMNKKVIERLRSINNQLLVNAKYFEGVPFQTTLF